MVYADTKEFVRTIAPSEKSRILSTEEVIFGEGGYLGTNSLFFRKSLLDQEPMFRQVFRYDYTLQIMGSLRNGIYYIAEIMSSYRWMAKNSWTVTVCNVEEKHKIFLEKKLRMFEQLNIDTEGRYFDAIEATRLYPEFLEKERNHRFKELKQEKYKCIFKMLPWKRRMGIKTKIHFRIVWHIRNFVLRRKK